MSEESKCNCQRCFQSIAFPSEMAGQDVTCPHCGRETTLSKPTVRKAETAIAQPAEPAIAESTIVCCYVLSILLPIVGFFCGLWLMTKKQSGHGAACMAISIFCFLIALAIFSQM
jgi:DNA-directed RNA polymerase subunit RPC12/RpoP